MSLNQICSRGGTNIFSPDVAFNNITTAQETTSKVLLASGTASAPSLTFQGDTNTGLYRIGTDAMGLVSNGSNKIAIDASWGTISTFKEGEFTPVFASGVTANAGQQTFKWQRINNMVKLYVQFDITNSSGGALSFATVNNIPVDIRPTTAQSCSINCSPIALNLSGLSACVLSTNFLQLNFEQISNALTGQLPNGSTYNGGSTVISYYLA